MNVFPYEKLGPQKMVISRLGLPRKNDQLIQMQVKMKRICPNPVTWNEVFQPLSNMQSLVSALRQFLLPRLFSPVGIYSNDLEKMQRWTETVAWANTNGCGKIVDEIREQDFYLADILF